MKEYYSSSSNSIYEEERLSYSSYRNTRRRHKSHSKKRERMDAEILTKEEDLIDYYNSIIGFKNKIKIKIRLTLKETRARNVYFIQQMALPLA